MPRTRYLHRLDLSDCLLENPDRWLGERQEILARSGDRRRSLRAALRGPAAPTARSNRPGRRTSPSAAAAPRPGYRLPPSEEEPPPAPAPLRATRRSPRAAGGGV